VRVDYIALSIPAFFLLIFIELAVSRWKQRRLYRMADSIADLGCGVVQQITLIFSAALIGASYKYLYSNHRLMEIPMESIAAWVAVFFGVDFAYYWFHRLSHEVNFLWGAHVVHHQSEEYNLAVALRQAAFQPWFSWIFYLPMAVIGFPPIMFGTIAAFSTIYQFWIHTKLIGKLGPLEWFLNTPSHHRVHHGRNPEYIDRNHGATLIIWDRLFGTFEEEKAEVIYGVTEPVKSWNPVWVNFHYYRDLLRDTRGARSWGDKIKVWLKPPGWRPPSDPTPEPRSIALDAPKWDPPISNRMLTYVFINFVLALPLIVVLIFMKKHGPAVLAPFGVLALGTFLILGGLLDNRRWARLLEPVRLVASVAMLAFFFLSP
jgi:sterol desaturase/sphingolipid hydroxylase (fatty acid hydroxylase superfamily)